jgi:hypothetical protein
VNRTFTGIVVGLTLGF